MLGLEAGELDVDGPDVLGVSVVDSTGPLVDGDPLVDGAEVAGPEVLGVSVVAGVDSTGPVLGEDGTLLGADEL